MKADELMIGDWVNVLDFHLDGSPYTRQVNGITKKHGTYYLQFGSALSADIDRCEPIPITHEILEKNGFKKEYERIWVLREKGKQPFVIEYLAGYWCPSYGKEAIATLQYLHELQHVFKLVHSKNTIEL